MRGVEVKPWKGEIPAPFPIQMLTIDYDSIIIPGRTVTNSVGSQIVQLSDLSYPISELSDHRLSLMFIALLPSDCHNLAN